MGKKYVYSPQRIFRDRWVSVSTSKQYVYKVISLYTRIKTQMADKWKPNVIVYRYIRANKNIVNYNVVSTYNYTIIT